MSYITPLHGSPAVSWTTNIHPSILWHFVKYNLYQIRCDYPAIDPFQPWLDKLSAIESERQSEAERVGREQAERDRLTASPIPPSIGVLARYETHINNQLMQALERLNTLQGQKPTSS